MTLHGVCPRLRAGVFAAEPRWLPQRLLTKNTIPEEVLGWLLDPQSLTRRVQALCRACFRVEVVSQQRERPMFNERRLLEMGEKHLAVVRQVRLWCGNQPWVFARTVIPNQTLTGPLRRLAHLGDKPLGAMLFASPSLRRFEVQVARLLPQHNLFAMATDNLNSKPGEIWGRRSVFHLHGRPLLVSEIFLPQLLQQH